jgi:hypothetical protein
MAGVSTIEHGDNGTPEIFKLMKEKKLPFAPHLQQKMLFCNTEAGKKEQTLNHQKLQRKENLFKMHYRQA